MEQERKYELTGETKEVRGILLHKIRALKSFGSVKKGDEGGWIEKEKNLSQFNNAWVAENAMVYGDAMVFGNAMASENVRLYGNAEASGNARLYGNARLCGNAMALGNARVYENAMMYENAWAYGDTWVYGNAMLHGYAGVNGNACVCGNAEIYKKRHVLSITNIGSRLDTTTFFHTDAGGISVKCGCFYGTMEEFVEKVKKTHHGTIHEKTYLLAVEMAKNQIKGWEEDETRAKKVRG